MEVLAVSHEDEISELDQEIAEITSRQGFISQEQNSNSDPHGHQHEFCQVEVSQNNNSTSRLRNSSPLNLPQHNSSTLTLSNPGSSLDRTFNPSLVDDSASSSAYSSLSDRELGRVVKICFCRKAPGKASGKAPGKTPGKAPGKQDL